MVEVGAAELLAVAQEGQIDARFGEIGEEVTTLVGIVLVGGGLGHVLDGIGPQGVRGNIWMARISDKLERRAQA